MADDSLHQAMHAPIGQVAMDSGHASMALQQVIEAVTGTGLIYFTMRDSPLGTQLSTAKTIVEHAGTNEWISHPRWTMKSET